MTLVEIKRLCDYRGIAVVMPLARGSTGFVESWDLLGLASDIDDAVRMMSDCEARGFFNAVPVSLSEDIVIEGALAAKFYRVLFDQNYLARLAVFYVNT